MAILFVMNIAIMLIIGMLKPRSEAFELTDAGAVDLQEYKYRYIAGGAIVVVVILSYIIFS